MERREGESLYCILCIQRTKKSDKFYKNGVCARSKCQGWMEVNYCNE